VKTYYLIFLSFLFASFLRAQNSSCKVSYSLTGKTIDTECQACYKNNSCFILSYENNFNNCSQKIQVEDNVNCFTKYLFYGVFNTESMESIASKIIAAKTFKVSKCMESNSGDHLWKTTNESEPKQFMHADINLLSDYCELWGKIDSETRAQIEFLMRVCIEENK
jgi:hypothetical protein